MRILLYIIIISIGIFISYKELVSKNIFNRMSSIQYACLLFLLFVMGIKIGINKDVLVSFHKLGFTAIVISIFSIAFSILGVKFISKFVNEKEKVK